MSTHWRGPNVTLGLTRAISSRMATTQYGTCASESVVNSSTVSTARAPR